MSDSNNSRIFRLALSAIIVIAGMAATRAVATGTAIAGAAGVHTLAFTSIPVPASFAKVNGEPWGGS
ncbi:hypothetical protein [Streptosporangium sp. NPDC000396]|uniref:hypothetical protein n=1 Tax=Streptosporangium sp. NPDC000396 TaxID=3366185 RepID=UPI003684B19F